MIESLKKQNEDCVVQIKELKENIKAKELTMKERTKEFEGQIEALEKLN